MKKFALFLALILCTLTSSLQAQGRSATAVDQATGNGVAVWELFDYGTFSYVLHAAILDGSTGTWGTPVIISDPTISAHAPKAAVNANGSIAVIWEGDDPIGGLWFVCGATYDTTLAAWNSPTVLSGATETLISQDDFFVKISAADEVSVTYVSYDYSTSTEHLRGIFSPTYGTWASPVTID